MTRRKARPSLTSRPAQELYAGHCDPCGKRLWVSRAAAKQAALRAFPGDRMSAYRCPAGAAGFHFGHLAWTVVRGVETRDEARESRRGRSS